MSWKAPLRLLVASALVLLGCAMAAWCAWVTFVAWTLGGLFGLRHLSDLILSSAVEVAVVFCLAAILIGVGSRSIWLTSRRAGSA